MALKALSKDEELAAVPVDKPVLVQLPEFVDENAPDDGADVKQPGGGDGIKAEDAGVRTLQEQLDALRKANELESKQSRERVAEAERRAEKADRDRLAALADKATTESDAVSQALNAAQAEQASAKAALKAAGEAGDWEAIGEAQARIGRAASDIREYERQAAMLAAQTAAQKDRPAETVTRQAPTDINAAIDANPQLLDTERVWLKAHPEALIDPTRNKELDVAYVKATRKGLSRGTPDYFKFIETEMGYAPAKAEDNSEMTVSAPVHRNERDNEGRTSGGKITLTPEERELARSMGVTDIEYARQKVNFDAARKADPEKYR